MDAGEVRRRLEKAAEDFGVPFKGSDRLYNTRLAQELGLWAGSKGRGDEFHSAVFRAYFVDGRNIGDIPVLVELTSSVGLPADEAADVLETRAFKPAVDADWALSREKSITAVPTFLMKDDRLVGAQPYYDLERLLQSHGFPKRMV